MENPPTTTAVNLPDISTGKNLTVRPPNTTDSKPVVTISGRVVNPVRRLDLLSNLNNVLQVEI